MKYYEMIKHVYEVTKRLGPDGEGFDTLESSLKKWGITELEYKEDIPWDKVLQQVTVDIDFASCTANACEMWDEQGTCELVQSKIIDAYYEASKKDELVRLKRFVDRDYYYELIEKYGLK